MIKKAAYLISLLLVLGAAGIASAAAPINYWTPPGASTDWNVAENWDKGHIPYNNPADYSDPLNEEAKMNGATGTCPVVGIGSTVDAFRIFVGSSVYGEFTIDGGIVTTSGYITSAYWPTDVALITMTDGDVQIGLTGGINGHFYCGREGTATFNMSGGNFTIINNLNIGQYASGNGTINLSGGTLIANNLVSTGTALIDITNSGKLVLLGDDTAVVETWISNGWLTAYGGTGTVNFDYNITNPGDTTVWATVEGEKFMYWIGNFGEIALANIENRDQVCNASSQVTLSMNGDVEISADNSDTARLVESGGDHLYTEYKLEFDGDGVNTTGRETVDFTSYDSFLSSPVTITYVPDDNEVQVTLSARASNYPGQLANTGNYTATQTLTATWLNP